MADLIDRHWLMERLGLMDDCRECQYCHGPLCSMGSEFVIACEAISDAPSVQTEPRWIPCSERLPEHPENDDYYLVTIQCEHHDGWDDYVTGFAEWTKHGWDELSCYIGQIKVVAWMPLPEPYKEDSDG